MSQNIQEVDFGQTWDTKHALDKSAITDATISDLTNKYAEFRQQAIDLSPNLGRVLGNPAENLPKFSGEQIRGLINTLSPEIEAIYEVSSGDCTDLSTIEIELLHSKLIGPVSIGFNVFGVEVSLSISGEIIPTSSQIENCSTSAFLEYVRTWQSYQAQLYEWQRSLGRPWQGLRPPPQPPPEEFSGVPFIKNGRKCRNFLIRWYVTVTVLRLEYTKRIGEDSQVICTKCCE